MKKVLSILLSFILIFSGFTCLSRVALATENGWLYNGAAARIILGKNP